ncbi:NAD-dependent epimerase/dehydratase family protein [Puniceicoccales bacterium CK1056]|uniref:NAD-dependent epimerase/dehydratase family protein n=1 Tax=Oceanipulchritudo coccoides TaxID=2706888 RepID=A0A6B2M553_9BACT|nr:NAD-dependent epimerase/dehydratase family protein [Oceanipulchritudo coccoides]NDV62790.1 NAD-dependent epimerase/dehydratase family protein [Oceanipulchritudo coccoides]
MVTGATGYVAGWIVRRLLDEGFHVHAAVRDPDNHVKVEPLRELALQRPGTITFFRADLLEEGSYSEAMEGCGTVFHTASPFLLHFRDPQKELIEPALRGTRNVLQSVDATPSVQRVVITSSCAAIYGDNADIAEAKGDQFSEDDWNTTSSLDHKPYSYSKTLAEQAAWEMCRAQDRWDLVTINPSLVLGPGVGQHGSSGSFELIGNIGSGKLRTGVPSYPFGAVDVREVAEAHLRAGTDFSVAGGRYILSGHNTDLPEIVSILKNHFGKAHPFPCCTLPKWLTWLVAPMVDKSMTRRLVSRNVGVPAGFNNRKSREQLGIEYRPLEESVVEMFEQMKELLDY